MSLNRIRRLEVAVKELNEETEKFQKQIQEIAEIVSQRSQVLDEVQKEMAKMKKTAEKLIQPVVTKPRRKTKT